MTEHPQDHQSEEPSYAPRPSGPTPPYSTSTPQYAGGQAPYQPVPMSPADQRTWAIASHLSAFLSAIVALSFLGPLIMYLVLKDRGDFVRKHSSEILNFQLTMWIGLLISFPLMFVGIGVLMAIAIGLAMLVFQILGAVAASEGREYRYPVTIRFVH